MVIGAFGFAGTGALARVVLTLGLGTGAKLRSAGGWRDATPWIRAAGFGRRGWLLAKALESLGRIAIGLGAVAMVEWTPGEGTWPLP